MKVKAIYSTNEIGKLNALELCHGNTNAFLAYFKGLSICMVD